MTANLPNQAKRDQTSGNVIRKIRKYGKTGITRKLSETSASPNASVNQQLDGAFRTIPARLLGEF
jgi:hypothetical protein